MRIFACAGTGYGLRISGGHKYGVFRSAENGENMIAGGKPAFSLEYRSRSWFW
jgi:hypothetical protein